MAKITVFYCHVLLVFLAIGAQGVSLENTCGNYISSPSFTCQGDGEGETQALEIQDLTTSIIYASGGDDPMTYDEFITYSSPVGKWSLNSPRNLQFESNCFFKSPGTPTDCTDACVEYTTVKVLNDTTWASLALNVCGGYFPSGDTDIEFGAPPQGQVSIW